MSDLDSPPFYLTDEKITSSGDVWLCWKHTSGLTHWHCQNLYRGAAKETFAASVKINTPSSDGSGVAHALEHMVLRGCHKLPSSRRFWQLKASLALTEFNATTRRGNTRFHLSGHHREDAKHGLNYFIQSVLTPLLRETDWNQNHDKGIQQGERNALYQELVGYQGFDEFNQACSMSTELKYPLYCGDPGSVSSLTHQDLTRYYWRHYQPENMTLITAGEWSVSSIWEGIVTALLYREAMQPKDLPMPEKWLSKTRKINDSHLLTIRMSDQKAVQLYRMLSEGHVQATLKTLGYSLFPLSTMLDPKPTIRMKSDTGEYDELMGRYLSLLVSQWTESREAINIWHEFNSQQNHLYKKKWGDSLVKLYQSVTAVNEGLLFPVSKREPIGDWLPKPMNYHTITLFARLPRDNSVLSRVYRQWLKELMHYMSVYFRARNASVSFDEQSISGLLSDIQCLTITLSCSALIFWQHFDEHLRQHLPTGFHLSELKSDQAIFTPANLPHSVSATSPEEPYLTVELRDDGFSAEFRLPKGVSLYAQSAAAQWVLSRQSIIDLRLSGQFYSLSATVKPERNALVFTSHFDRQPEQSRRLILEEIQAFSLKNVKEKEVIQAFQGGKGLMLSMFQKHRPSFYQTAYHLLGISLEEPESESASNLAFTFAMWKTALAPYLKTQRRS